MKLILSILLFSSLTLAQNIWYLNKNATGTSTGRNWPNAWTHFDSSNGWGAPSTGLNWQALSSGDTIYVHGDPGDTTFYTGTVIQPLGENDGDGVTQPTYAVTFDPPVVICRSWESDHNGVVAISNSSPVNYVWIVQGIKGVKFSGMTIMNSISGDDGSLGYTRGANLIFDNMHFAGNGYNPGFGLSGQGNTIQNSLLDHIYSNSENELDLLGCNGGRGGMTFNNNIVIFRNDNIGTEAHRDMIQMSNFGYLSVDTTVTVRISNNLFIDAEESGDGWNGGIYSSGPYAKVNFYVYNNIIVSRKQLTTFTPIWMGTPGVDEWVTYDLVYKSKLWCFNNTIIMKGQTGSRAFSTYNFDSLFVYNNLVVIDSLTDIVWQQTLYNPSNYMYFEIDYNAYMDYDGVSVGDWSEGAGFGVYDWNDWITHNSNGNYFDNNSVTGLASEITFADKYGLNKSDYLTTTGRDVGVDVGSLFPQILAKYPDIAYDILGNPRDSNWDMGALEFQGTPPPATEPSKWVVGKSQ